jgi:hypothetical protein
MLRKYSCGYVALLAFTLILASCTTCSESTEQKPSRLSELQRDKGSVEYKLSLWQGRIDTDRATLRNQPKIGTHMPDGTIWGGYAPGAFKELPEMENKVIELKVRLQRIEAEISDLQSHR